MKKTLTLVMVFLLAVSLLTACLGEGGSNTDSGNNGNGNSPKAINDVILASALISAEEATAIMEQKMERSESDSLKLAFIDRVKYVTEDGPSVSVNLYQEALYDESNETQQKAMKNGWEALLQRNEKALIKKVEEGHEEVTTTKLEGIGRAAYLDDSKLGDIWIIYVFYGEYMFYISILYDLNKTATEDQQAWFIEKNIELCKLALENLIAIVG